MILISSLLFLKVHFLIGLTKSSRDQQRFASDPFRIIRSEKDRSRRDVVRLTDPPERRLRFQRLTKIALGETAGGRAFRDHHSRINGVHPDSSRTELLREGMRDCIDRTFRSEEHT